MSSAKRGKSEKLPSRLNEAAFRAAVGLISLGLCEFAAAAAAEAPAASPEAGEGDGMQLEEVVVTAQKREESLQKVPLSVVALGADELSRRNITSLADLMGGQVPAQIGRAHV